MLQIIYYVDSRIERLARAFSKAKKAAADVPRIQVSALVGEAAFLYEKLRNAIEYREEHLLRKAAIERILKRKFAAGISGVGLARPIIEELIRAHYLPNNAIPETKAEEVAFVLNKYIHLFNVVLPRYKGKEKRKTAFWLLGIAAYEVEALLGESHSERALVDFMAEVMEERIQFFGRGVDPEKKHIQIYIATHRALIRSDYSIICYYYLLHRYPEWRNANFNLIERVGLEINSFRKETEEIFESPVTDKLHRLMQRYIGLFHVLRLTIEKDPTAFDKLLNQPKKLEEAVEEAYLDLYKGARKKLTRRSIRSIIYIFLTKMLMALAVEVPYDFFIAAAVNSIPLLVNVTFHPLLMFFITLTIRLPGKENLQKINEGIRDLIYNYEGKNIVYKIKARKKRSWLLQTIFTLFYTISFLIPFTVLVYLLWRLQFSWISGLIFVIFLSVISFFGVRLRQQAKELIGGERRENIFGALFDFFTLPILKFGRWLSLNFARINFFAFILDVLIEAPFKAFIEIVEDWFSFVREKKEEVY